MKAFDSYLETIVKSDSFDEAIEEVLVQIHENGEKYLVAYCSRKMQSVEINYDIGDKELLAIVYCLKE